MPTHTGGCHCGKVRFEVDAPADLEVLDCNCSICSKTGYLHLIVPRSHFRLLAGEESLTTYTFNTGTARHYFCATCGIKPYYVPRSHPDGYSVNTRCLDPGTVRAIAVTECDGRNWESTFGPAVPPASAQSPTIRLRDARSGEAALLSALALRSKASWGYDEAFIDACRAELTYTPARLRDPRFRFVVVVADSDLCGFYALETRAPQRFELDALFVEPDRIGTGIGRTLIDHAIAAVRKAGGTSLVIQGDPHAADFYRAAGARRIGSRPSGSIEGRELPLFEITIGR